MKITVAYSPDTDDAFMVEAIKSGLVQTRGYDFEFSRGDIQELNIQALEQQTFDITAVSVAALPVLSDDYEMMQVGCSIGRNFGPKVVVKSDSKVKNLAELNNKKIATPGPNTSAFIASLDLLERYNPVHTQFDHIERLVLSGEADAGILIHELQLTTQQKGLKIIADLGNLWGKKFSCPIPLGANAVRKSLPAEVKNDLEEIFFESVDFALTNWETILPIAMKESTKGLDLDIHKGKDYIEMYANQDSLRVSKDTLVGFKRLFSIGVQHQLYSKTQIKNLGIDL